MMRIHSSFAAVFVLTACSDSAQVLTPPDSSTPETSTLDATADTSTDVTRPNDATASDASDASDDADAGCLTGFEMCNGSCIDVTTYQTDGKNCGWCAHDCLGNACTKGVCAADLIGTNLANPSTIAVDSNNVYFTTIADGLATSGSVYQCPVTGCPGNLAPMTTGLNNPESIAVNATTVFWDNTGAQNTANGTVMSCPIAGCGNKNVNRKTIAKNLQFILGIALDSTNVYFGTWGASPFYGNGNIDSCPLAGCSGAPSKVLTGVSKPQHVAVDSASVYMATVGGGAAPPIVQSGLLPGPSSGTNLYSGNAIQDNLMGFALYGNNFFFSNAAKGEMDVCPITGCPTTIPALTSTVSNPADVVADAVGIYWIDDKGIEWCPSTGCPQFQPLLLATSANFPQSLAVNGSFVYWVEQDQTQTAGQVLRVPR